jgi:hypothetical protein
LLRRFLQPEGAGANLRANAMGVGERCSDENLAEVVG